MKLFIFITFLFSFLNPALSKTKAMDPVAELKRMTLQYSHQGYVYSYVKKVTTSAFFSNKPKSVSGKIYFAKNHLKMIFDDEPKQIFLYKNGKSWVKSGKDPVVDLKKQAKHPLLSLVVGDDKDLDKFKIKLMSQKDKKIVLELKPKSSKSSSGFKKSILDIDTTRPTIDKLTFWDDLGNKTEIIFEKTRFKKKFNKNYFTI